MSATLTLFLVIWATVKYSVLFKNVSVWSGFLQCIYPIIVLSVMLSVEFFPSCKISSAMFSVYVVATLLPFLPGAKYSAHVGFASVLVMAARLFATGCILRGAVALSSGLVACAILI